MVDVPRRELTHGGKKGSSGTSRGGREANGREVPRVNHVEDRNEKSERDARRRPAAVIRDFEAAHEITRGSSYDPRFIKSTV